MMIKEPVDMVNPSKAYYPTFGPATDEDVFIIINKCLGVIFQLKDQYIRCYG